MKRPENMKKGFDAIVLIIIFLFGTLFGTLIVEPKTIYKSVYIEKTQPQFFSKSTIYLAAVDNQGNGLAIPLSVEIRSGDGKVLTNIDKLLFWIDTQHSIRTAKLIATNVSKINTDKYDISYTIETDVTTIVGGPSAGAALTIATIAALENKTLKNNVMITGTINEDGTIGKVGMILEKAKAAKQIGATTFIVPEGEGTQTYYKPEEKCIKQPGFTYCETTYKQETVSIGENAGITVVEVSNIEDALRYFI